MADTADFKTMYAMLKVHSANQAKEIERLQERLANPPADAALIGKLRHQLAQVTEECAALRALAVPEAVAKARIVEILNGERVENDGNTGDTGYNMAIDHCIAAILSAADDEVKK